MLSQSAHTVLMRLRSVKSRERSITSISLDVFILFKTGEQVLKREGIGQSEEAPGNLYDERWKNEIR